MSLILNIITKTASTVLNFKYLSCPWFKLLAMLVVFGVVVVKEKYPIQVHIFKSNDCPLLPEAIEALHA